MVNNKLGLYNKESDVLSEFIRIASEKDSLYDVDITDDKNGSDLIDIAHPDRANILNSYIYNGGVVENANEQQRNSIEVATKLPTGRVYVRSNEMKELVDELIIVADEMDVRGENDLAKFADNILNRLEKVAVAPLLIGGIAAGVAALAGGYYYLIHMTEPASYGVDKDLESLKNALEDVKQKRMADVGEGESKTAEAIDDLEKLCDSIQNSRNGYLNFMKKASDTLKSKYSVTVDKDAVKAQQRIERMSNDPAITSLVEKINNATAKYSEYVEKVALPQLKGYESHLKVYFDQLKNTVKDSDARRGTFDTITDWLSKGDSVFTQSYEEITMKALTATIKSIDNDHKIRNFEKDQFVKKITSNIKTDIGSEFEDTSLNDTSSQTATSAPKPIENKKLHPLT